MRLVWSFVLLTWPLTASAQSPAPAQHPARLVLATYGDAAQSEIAEPIVREAYRRLGIGIEIQHFAGDVAIERSQNGTLDGDLQRVDGVADRFPSLIQIPVPIGFTDVAVYSRDSTLHVRDWRDLSQLNVAAVRGVIAIERATGELRVRYVDTYAELYPLLLTRKVDAIVAPVVQTTIALRGKTAGIYRNDLIGSYLLYHYLHRRNEALEPEIARVLRGMLLDGTIARIRQARLAELLR